MEDSFGSRQKNFPCIKEFIVVNAADPVLFQFRESKLF